MFLIVFESHLCFFMPPEILYFLGQSLPLLCSSPSSLPLLLLFPLLLLLLLLSTSAVFITIYLSILPLGCFQFPSAMNNAVYERPCVSWTCGCVLLGIQLGLEMLGHEVCMLLISVVITSFLKWLYQFTFAPALYECSCFAPSSALGIVSLKKFSYSGIYIVVFHCGFNLCYSDG